MLEKISQFFMPVNSNENPAWFYKSARLIFALTLLALPLVYDLSVPEVAGDPRWSLIHWSALSLIALYFISKITTGGTVKLSMPLSGYLAAALAVIASLTYLWTVSEIKSWWFLKHFLAYITLFFFAYALRDEKWYRNLIWIVAFTLLYNSVLGIFQFFGISDADVNQYVPFRADILNFFLTTDSKILKLIPHEHLLMQIDYFRMSAPPAGTLSNKNLAGSYVIMVLPAIMYLFLTAKLRWEKIASITIFTVATIFLVYTRSRGSWIACGASLIFMATWLAVNSHQRELFVKAFTKQKLITLAASAIVIIAASFATSPLKGYHSIDRSVSNQVQSIVKLTSGEIGTRIAYNRNAIEIVKDNPWGIGIGAFHTIYPMYHDAGMKTPPLGFSIKARPQRMHNDLGQAFVEMGIIGGLLYIALFITIIIMTWKMTIKLKGNENAGLLTFFTLTGIVAIGVNCLGDFPLQMPTAPSLLWISMGIITGLYVMHVKDSNITISNKEVKIHGAVYLVCAAATLTALYFVYQDDTERRAGAKLLKPGISQIRSNNFSLPVVNLLNRSYNIYPLNTRTREYLGVAMVNSKDKRIPINAKIKVLKEMVKYDPYTPNGNINLCGLYLQKAREASLLKDVKMLGKYIDLASEHHKLLLRVAPFSEHTHSLGGLIYLYQNKPFKAISSYKEALKYNPVFGSAVNGIKHVESMLKKTGRWGEYQRMQNPNPIRIQTPN